MTDLKLPLMAQGAVVFDADGSLVCDFVTRGHAPALVRLCNEKPTLTAEDYKRLVEIVDFYDRAHPTGAEYEHRIRFLRDLAARHGPKGGA